MMDLNAQDAANRIRALELESFIVEAPAGAGKTELLTQRYLKLLATVDEPEEIIALTFTNKAATEMRNRILLSLTHAEQQTPEIKAHKLVTRGLAEKALHQSNMKQWQILSQPSRLRILTIDALCSSFTRQMPLLSRFGGQPVVSDDTDTHYNDAARRAIAEIMHETKTDDTVTTALRYMDNNAEKLTELLAKMLARRDQWLPMVGRLHDLEPEAKLASTEHALRSLIVDDLQAALQVLPANVQQALMPLARFAASNLDSDADIAPLLDWQYTLSADAEDLIMWQALANLLLTQKGKYRERITVKEGFPSDKEHKSKKDDFTAIINCLENHEVVAKVLSLPSIATLADSQQVILALTKLLIKANGHLWLVFQAAGEVDFVEIARSAKLALENEHGATDLALQLDYKISHLLIDEFQDTSPVQMDLIEKLIEGWQSDDGRTLFCVGDPMQSIYRFRKADVSLFLQASKFGIGHLPLKRLQLSRNNRSQPAVVDWINAAFKQVFPATDNINQGAISYREFIASRTSIADEGVFVHPLIVDDATKNAEDEDATDSSSNSNVKQLEANFVANLITELHAKSSAPQKIAVLVRSRNHLKELVSEIRRNHSHLNFQAVEIEQLNERQTVQDALSLVCALHHRADRTHWLNVLRAPWCGLTLVDLHVLAANNHKDTIWSAMHDDARLQHMSADGLLRLNHVKTVLISAFQGQGRLPVRRWLESTWLQLGGGKCLVDAGDNRDVQVFFDLAEKTSRSGHLDIAALELAMQKLYAKPDIEADGSVQFLTIHKSKGLEFDTVILPALNRPPRPSDNELVLWQEVMVDHQMHLIAAPHYVKGASNKNATVNIYSYIKSLEKIRESNELVRLLYVAATRTERQLHLIASVQANKDGEIKPAANTLLHTLWPAVEAKFKQATPQSCNLSSSALDIKLFKPQLQRLDSSEFAGDFLQGATQYEAKNQPHQSAFDDQVTPPASFTGALTEVDFHRHCGILAHLYMELMAKPTQSWAGQRLTQCQPAMQKWLMQQGYASKLAEQGAIEVQAALTTTLNSEAGQWLLKNHTEAASELSLMQSTDIGIQSHVIDRTFVENGIDGKNVRWIVDYKLTALDENEDLTVVAEQHRPQLERYAGLFASEGLQIKYAIYFLSSGNLVEL